MKNNEEKTKNKSNKGNIFGKIMAIILLSAMVLASCSTCIYYVMATVK